MEKLKMYNEFVTESFDDDSVNEFFGQTILTIAAVVFAIKLLNTYVKNKKLENKLLDKIHNESDPEKRKQLKDDLRELKDHNATLVQKIKMKSDAGNIEKVDATEKAEAKIELEKIKKELVEITAKNEKIRS